LILIIHVVEERHEINIGVVLHVVHVTIVNDIIVIDGVLGLVIELRHINLTCVNILGGNIYLRVMVNVNSLLLFFIFSLLAHLT